MQRENIWKLMAGKMMGEATEEELSELENILKNDPVMKYTAETFSRLWDALSIQQPTPGNNPAMGTCEDG